MKRIAIFASGNGSNAQNIAEYFAENGKGKITAIYCNNPKAYVIQRAESLNIPLVLFNREQFYADETVLKDLINRKTDLIILAGFLWLLPVNLVKTFDKRIINIHPALLPKYGGKGMYGMAVHEAVIDNNEPESGITIHLIDEMYDKGDIIFQFKCPVSPDDTPDSLAEKVHKLEYQYYPKVISDYLHKI
ncbi:MAG TPA: phosphoribosylglycinamide formyltransferase [Lentimicrobium sp.]|nr:phosphoribosylglycinamide formyltransferase [Lentimicrobium sp.]